MLFRSVVETLAKLLEMTFMRVCCASKPVLETHKAASIVCPLSFRSRPRKLGTLSVEFHHAGTRLVVVMAGLDHTHLLLKHAGLFDQLDHGFLRVDIAAFQRL